MTDDTLRLRLRELRTYQDRTDEAFAHAAERSEDVLRRSAAATEAIVATGTHLAHAAMSIGEAATQVEATVAAAVDQNRALREALVASRQTTTAGIALITEMMGLKDEA